MAEFVGNLLVAQSGGPTAVINASLAGVIEEAGKHPEIEEIYGGRNGLLGILNEELIDLNEERARSIEHLKHTPGAALGTCRYKIGINNDLAKAAEDMDRLFEVLKAHNIRYFFYAGGNDSQDTANKLHKETIKRGYEVRVIGVPKTIDNDLPHTDHCPGYGSVIRYNSATVREVALDLSSMATDDGSCCIIEVMGRSAGWIAAGTVLAKQHPEDAPHIILLPEIPFAEKAFIDRVKAILATHEYCVVVVGEGLKNEAGEQVSVDHTRVDAFGHPLLSGVADHLASIVSIALGTKTRTVKLGYAQRSAAHFASSRDIEEAVACGAAAVQAAVDGKSGLMVKIIRRSNDPYEWVTGLQSLDDIANVEHLIPREWISEDGFVPNENFIQYARPLIEGQFDIPLENGLPKYVKLDKIPVEKKLPPRGEPAAESSGTEPVPAVDPAPQLEPASGSPAVESAGS